MRSARGYGLIFEGMSAQIRETATQRVQKAAEAVRQIKDDLATSLRGADTSNLREVNLRATFRRADTAGLRKQKPGLKEERQPHPSCSRKEWEGLGFIH